MAGGWNKASAAERAKYYLAYLNEHARSGARSAMETALARGKLPRARLRFTRAQLYRNYFKMSSGRLFGE